MSTENATHASEDVGADDESSTGGYAGSYDTTEGRVFTVTGGDWDTISGAPEGEKDRIVVNMGPQHPSTHGVLRLILEIDGETVTEARCGIGYLHTGIEKNLEFRSWVQGVTYVTRMDYLTSMFNETAYCLAVEKALGRHRADPRAGEHHPGDDDGAQPGLVAPGRAGDRRP